MVGARVCVRVRGCVLSEAFGATVAALWTCERCHHPGHAHSCPGPRAYPFPEILAWPTPHTPPHPAALHPTPRWKGLIAARRLPSDCLVATWQLPCALLSYLAAGWTVTPPPGP